MKRFATVFATLALVAVATLALADDGERSECTTCPLTPCGDITHDGDVTATDALAVLRKAVGLDADGNPNMPEECFFTMTNENGTRTRTRLIGDVGEESECFSGDPSECINE